MRRAALVTVLLVVVVAAVLATGANTFSLAADAPAANVQPKLTVYPSLVKLDTKANILVMGSGFKPGQQVHLLMPDGLGLTTDLVELVLPKPQPGAGVPVNQYGEFACVIVLGNHAKVQAESMTAITATDADFNALAKAPIAFADPNGVSIAGLYPTGKPDYTKTPSDLRPLPWTAPFFEYPKRPAK